MITTTATSTPIVVIVIFDTSSCKFHKCRHSPRGHVEYSTPIRHIEDHSWRPLNHCPMVLHHSCGGATDAMRLSTSLKYWKVRRGALAGRILLKPMARGLRDEGHVVDAHRVYIYSNQSINCANCMREKHVHAKLTCKNATLEVLTRL